MECAAGGEWLWTYFQARGGASGLKDECEGGFDPAVACRVLKWLGLPKTDMGADVGWLGLGRAGAGRRGVGAK